MFSGYTNANLPWQDTFYASLQDNGVKYFLAGHDHIHQRSIVASPNGKSTVQEIISASVSSKFYTPKPLTDAKWYDQKTRETSLSQERYTVGYSIYTVDGPCVTVDYYSDDHGNWASDNCYADGATPQSCTTPGTHITPTFTFVKKETFGYCNNGRQFLIPQGAAYTSVQDSFEGTTAQILDGTNMSTAQDYTGRSFTKTVNTGWVDLDAWGKKNDGQRGKADLVSNILKLHVMADLAATETDTYALSLSYDHHRMLPEQIKECVLALVARDRKGKWVNAVNLNTGGTKNFVLGPYKSGSALGTYGFDPNTRTVWAVIDYDGDFAAAALERPTDK